MAARACRRQSAARALVRRSTRRASSPPRSSPLIQSGRSEPISAGRAGVTITSMLKPSPKPPLVVLRAELVSGRQLLEHDYRLAPREFSAGQPLTSQSGGRRATNFHQHRFWRKPGEGPAGWNLPAIGDLTSPPMIRATHIVADSGRRFQAAFAGNSRLGFSVASPGARSTSARRR